MRKPIHLTAPPPTLEEMEKHFRIPKARKEELQALVDEFKAMLSNRKDAPVNSAEPEKRRKRASAA
jgi:anti-sigma factor RsiW